MQIKHSTLLLICKRHSLQAWACIYWCIYLRRTWTMSQGTCCVAQKCVRMWKVVWKWAYYFYIFLVTTHNNLTHSNALAITINTIVVSLLFAFLFCFYICYFSCFLCLFVSLSFFSVGMFNIGWVKMCFSCFYCSFIFILSLYVATFSGYFKWTTTWKVLCKIPLV